LIENNNKLTKNSKLKRINLTIIQFLKLNKNNSFLRKIWEKS